MEPGGMEIRSAMPVFFLSDSYNYLLYLIMKKRYFSMQMDYDTPKEKEFTDYAQNFFHQMTL